MNYSCFDTVTYLLDNARLKSEKLIKKRHQKTQKILFYIDELSVILCAAFVWSLFPSFIGLFTGVVIGVGTIFIPKNRFIHQYLVKNLAQNQEELLRADMYLVQFFKHPEHFYAFMQESMHFKYPLNAQQINDIEAIECKIKTLHNDLIHPHDVQIIVKKLKTVLIEYFFLKKQIEQVIKNQQLIGLAFLPKEEDIELSIGSDIDLKNA